MLFLKNTLALSSLFTILFLGDFNLSGTPLAILILPLLISLLTIVDQPKFSKYQLVILGLFFTLSVFFAFKTISASHPPGYVYWVLNFCFSLLIAMFLISGNYFNRFSLNDVFFALGLWLIFIIGGYFGFDGRNGFIFGPNVLYRVFVFFFLYIVFMTISLFGNSRLWFLILITLGLSSIILTQSRAAIPVFIVNLFIIYNLKGQLNKKIFYPLFIFVLGTFFWLINQPVMNDMRILQFDIESNNSLILRVNAYLFFIENFFDLIFSSGIEYSNFFKNVGDVGFSYPHNLILELIIYYGFLGFVTAFIVIKKFLFICFNEYSGSLKNRFFLSLCALGFLALQFSGSLADNYGFLALLLVTPIILYKKRTIRAIYGS